MESDNLAMSLPLAKQGGGKPSFGSPPPSKIRLELIIHHKIIFLSVFDGLKGASEFRSSFS